MFVLKSLLLLHLWAISISAQGLDEEGSKQFIDHPDKNEYLLSQPGTEKHKYGYELKENKHFHHTTTELDGVRLGCYGYSLNGKKYSTQYVADNKGYRPVYTYDNIEVYPKSGGVREASFIRNFDEDVDRSGNLRYFFPEGCRGFDSLISPQENPMTKRVNIPFSNNNVRTPSVKTKTSVLQKPQVPAVFNPPKSSPKKPLRIPEKYLPPSQNGIPQIKSLPPVPAPAPTPSRGKYVTKAIPQKASPPQPSSPRIAPSSFTKNNGLAKCADDESVPKIIIPIKLPSTNGKSDSCPSYAKLILPADNINVNSLRTNPNELAKMVLQSIIS